MPTTRNRRRALAVLAATGATFAVWAIAAAAGVDLAAREGSGIHHVRPAEVIAVSVLVGAAAWGLLAAFERFTARARTAWTRTALVVLVLSLAGPLGGLTAAAKLALTCMHLAAAALLIPLLSRTAEPAPRHAGAGGRPAGGADRNGFPVRRPL